MPDLEFQNLSTVQNNLQPLPKTVASAATIAPTGLITVVSGTAAIANITPPVTGAHMLVLIPSGAFTMVATGNIALAMAAATVSQPVLMFYNPATAKYHAGKLTSA
jgi:hypothetical protein